ncbi:hypothetical protein M422DRAFT_56601 [Sphaerobolus stellatus SS14]|uniref:Uncharacterized protein n=1 Tax=Sphaerobolus stellatus (strain SS14) TaxID=990650 RepID=A0A0C9UEW3_SPHS4|nr:hypothetical protein M422DRAFT_56601 [Sphaerobolus stellatus SS14]
MYTLKAAKGGHARSPKLRLTLLQLPPMSIISTPQLLRSPLNINTVSTTLDTAIKQGTTDVFANGALGESGAAAILVLIQQLQPGILTALTNISTKKSLFDALPITGLGSVAKANIKTLSTDTSTFETALINASPCCLCLPVS